MPISFQVLGAPGRDNAVLVHLDTGQSIGRFLFDCGYGCLESLSVHEIRQIDHVFFSHFHMDHVAGFDFLFRLNYNRPHPMRVWGPAGTRDLMAHRFQGFAWNLHADQSGKWIVHEIGREGVSADSFLTHEAFRERHPQPFHPGGSPLLSHADYTVDAIHLDHGTPCLGYLVRERPRYNIDTAHLAEMDLPPGRWLQELKADRAEGEVTSRGGTVFSFDALRPILLQETPGASFAYLTDFRMTEAEREAIAARIAGCDTLVCESQYLGKDIALARANFHMTAAETAELALTANAGRLVLFHVSDRYDAEERAALLGEAQEIFESTTFPEGWNAPE